MRACLLACLRACVRAPSGLPAEPGRLIKTMSEHGTHPGPGPARATANADGGDTGDSTADADKKAGRGQVGNKPDDGDGQHVNRAISLPTADQIMGRQQQRGTMHEGGVSSFEVFGEMWRFAVSGGVDKKLKVWAVHLETEQEKELRRKMEGGAARREALGPSKLPGQ